MEGKKPEDELERRMDEWKARGYERDRVRWGMLCDGFQSISGIPDDFCSADDPEDRRKLWEKYQEEEGNRTNPSDSDWRLYND